MLAHHKYQQARDRIVGAADNAYERLATTDAYKKNEAYLKAIQFCVITVSASATGFASALSHVERLGVPLAIVLAILTTSFVEAFFFTLKHGLSHVYRGGLQRLYAAAWYRILMATMILNVALLGLWVFGVSPPAWLLTYNHYVLGIHFGAALLGVTMIRDADPVTRNRVLELRATTARQDVITARRVAAIGNPMILIGAKLRGWLDSLSIAFRLFWRGGGFAKSYVEEVETIAQTQYAHLSDITNPHGRPTLRPAGSVQTLPKGPAHRP